MGCGGTLVVSTVEDSGGLFFFPLGLFVLFCFFCSSDTLRAKD